MINLVFVAVSQREVIELFNSGAEAERLVVVAVGGKDSPSVAE